MCVTGSPPPKLYNRVSPPPFSSLPFLFMSARKEEKGSAASLRRPPSLRPPATTTTTRSKKRWCCLLIPRPLSPASFPSRHLVWDSPTCFTCDHCRLSTNDGTCSANSLFPLIRVGNRAESSPSSFSPVFFRPPYFFCFPLSSPLRSGKMRTEEEEATQETMCELRRFAPLGKKVLVSFQVIEADVTPGFPEMEKNRILAQFFCSSFCEEA